MDNLLCDELLQEIFTRIPKLPSSSSAVSPAVCLVSKRWLHLYRSSRTCLSIKVNPENSTLVQSFLPNYPFLSSLNLLSPDPTESISPVDFCDHLIIMVAAFCSKLKHLSFLVGPLSPPCLLSLTSKFPYLTSLEIALSRRPLFLNWVAFFSCLKKLSIRVVASEDDDDYCNLRSGYCCSNGEVELSVETLVLSGITMDDGSGFGWLWRSCTNLKKLHLQSCESIGDVFSFIKCLKGLQEIHLTTCRTIAGFILLRLAENCHSLNSLFIHDGGSHQGLLHFITNCRSNLQKVDLRLPLDLNNVHLSAMAINFRGLSSLKLQSCCLKNGQGLRAFGVNSRIEELSLINCDIVVRESGLLAGLGQHFRGLRKLDLSRNEFLLDKELISMLVSCTNLVELKLSGCKAVTGMTLLSMLKNCKILESVDVSKCSGIDYQAIELFILNSPRLRTFQVEQSKLSHVASAWAAKKFIQVFT
ncbi:RNI-like superfamily protein [Euphorbia peplus]|nr:RNI-like superfamily protein [Euphorbia peplus]